MRTSLLFALLPIVASCASARSFYDYVYYRDLDVDDRPAVYSAEDDFYEVEEIEPTTTVEPTTTGDPLALARQQAIQFIMTKMLLALGPEFQKSLPKAPSNDSMPTVSAPINITSEPCPHMYKRCSSQTFFPSCSVPRNTVPEVWAQRFNLYFNLSEEFLRDADQVLNATLRLYKNLSLPLAYPTALVVHLHQYTKSLTKRRDKSELAATTTVLSDYVGWISLDVVDVIRRLRPRHNHGFHVTVQDYSNITWSAPELFVTMDCHSDNGTGLVPLPFEVMGNDESAPKYPALNVRSGTLDGNFQELISESKRLRSPSHSRHHKRHHLGASGSHHLHHNHTHRHDSDMVADDTYQHSNNSGNHTETFVAEREEFNQIEGDDPFLPPQYSRIYADPVYVFRPSSLDHKGNFGGFSKNHKSYQEEDQLKVNAEVSKETELKQELQPPRVHKKNVWNHSEEQSRKKQKNRKALHHRQRKHHQHDHRHSHTPRPQTL